MHCDERMGIAKFILRTVVLVESEDLKSSSVVHGIRVAPGIEVSS